VTLRRRPSKNDRRHGHREHGGRDFGNRDFDDWGSAVDLFDDPPWRPDRDQGRTSRGRLRHLGFVLFLVFLALLGGGLALAAVAVVSFFATLKLDIGPLNFSITPPSPSAYGIDIALSADGTRAYVTEPSNDQLVVLDTHTGAVLATVAVGDTPSGLALSPNGSQVWVVDTDLSDTIFGSSSTTTGPPSTTGSPSTTGPPLKADQASVTVVSTVTDSVVGTITVPDFGPIDVAFSPDGHSAYLSNNGTLFTGSVTVIDTSTLAVVGTIAPTIGLQPNSPSWNPTSVAVSSDGGQVWVSAVNDTGDTPGNRDDVDVFATGTGVQVAEIPVGAGPFFMVLSADGRDAYVADKVSCDIRQIDTSTMKVVATVSWPQDQGCPFGLAAAPDGVVYTVTGDDHTFNEGSAGDAFGSVHFASPAAWAPSAPPQATIIGSVGTDPVTVALSPNGTEAYVVDADVPAVYAVNTATGAVTSTFTLPY
jgi:YVTN family beta-propeller protein